MTSLRPIVGRDGAVAIGTTLVSAICATMIIFVAMFGSSCAAAQTESNNKVVLQEYATCASLDTSADRQNCFASLDRNNYLAACEKMQEADAVACIEKEPWK